MCVLPVQTAALAGAEWPWYLFDVQEVLCIKGDGRSRHGDVLVQGAAVADVGLHGEGHRFGLHRGEGAQGSHWD